MSKGKSSGSTTQTSTAQPWAGAQPYLLGYDQNSPGVFPNAAQQFQQGGWTPGQQQQTDAWSQYLQGQQQTANNQAAYGNALMAGTNNAQISPVGAVGPAGTITAPTVSAQNVAAQNVDPTQALSSLGAVDPTKALQNQLSGSVSNPYLDQQIAAIGNDLSTNLNNNVLPGLRSQAVASGQYGGSRQGIAEGLALQGVNQQLSNAAANLRGSAYESAQNRQANAASNLSNLGFTNATNNANRDLTAQTTNAGNQLQASMANASNSLAAQNANVGNAMSTDQFNAGLGLSNNSQAIQNSANNTNNYVAGSNIVGSGLNYGNNVYGQGLTNLGLGQQQNWQNLNNYANIISSGAGLGGTTSTTGSSPNQSNPVAGILGGGLAGAQLGQLAGIGGPWGAAAGAGLGLLGSIIK